MLLLRLLRGLVRSPALTIAATLCTAVGVAATTAVATLANAVLLRPVPFPDADRLVRIWLEEPGIDPRFSLSIPESRDLRLPVFEQVFATARVRVVAVHKDGAERLRGEGVDRGYFERLAVAPAAGRLFTATDHHPSASPVIVLSHGLWSRVFGADPGAIGSTFRTQRGVYTIVGVTPRWFNGTVEQDLVEFWLPIEHYEPHAMVQDRESRQTWVFASVAHGVTQADAAAALASTTNAWKQRDPDRYRNLRLRLEPFGDSWRQEFRRGTVMLGAAAGLLLLVAALNVGCLLLARVLDRRREFAIRRALGAGRARLVRQLLLEALAVSVGGGLLGVAVGPVALEAMLAIAPIALPSYLTVEPDLSVAFAAGIVLVLSGLLAGVAPALASGTIAAADALETGSRGVLGGMRERRWISWLIAGEIAVTLVILFAGGLLIRSLDRLDTIELGYRRDGIARLAITFAPEDAGRSQDRAALYQRIARAAAETPRVTAVGLVAETLPPWDAQRGRVHAPDFVETHADGLAAGVHLSDHGFFATLGIPIVAGRSFHDGETYASAIVSQRLAERLGGRDAALGRTIRVTPDQHGGPEGTFAIVGVAGDVAYDGLAEQGTQRTLYYDDPSDPRAQKRDVYLPLARFPLMRVSVAAASDGAPPLDAVRRNVARIVPGSAIHWTDTMTEAVAVEYAPARFYSMLVASFSAAATLLSAVGLFALLWHTASSRTGEMGLRSALGASRARIALLIVKSALRPLAAGTAAGVLGALWCGDWLRGFLYGVGPLDGKALAVSILVVLGVGLCASALPARRAAAVDPLVALKTE